MTFNVLIVDKDQEGAISRSIQEIGEDQLPEGRDVTVAVEYSTLNYKDGLCLTGGGGRRGLGGDGDSGKSRLSGRGCNRPEI